MYLGTMNQLMISLTGGICRRWEMNKLLDLLAEIEASVEWAVDDRKDRENIMDWIHQAMDIAVQGKAHKWPEEKPEKDGQYLIRIISPIGSVYYRIRGSEEWHDFGNYITHWWNLPEVGNETI